MTKKLFFILASSLLIASCSKHEIVPITPPSDDQQATKDRAKEILGNIDPAQEWNSIKSGSVTIVADAQLQDIVKIQILTESPILNENAKVLAEANVKKGESVTLSYDAPNVYSQLMAA
jgi:lipopolysaccharide export system protein LptA